MAITPGRKLSTTTSAFVDHLEERVARDGILEIERQRSLAAVDREKATGDTTLRGRQRAQVVTDARILDLHDVGAHVGEDHRQERAGQQTR